MKKALDVITKKEFSFWWAIIGIVVGVVWWCAGVQAELSAMENKGVKLRTEYEQAVFDIRSDLRIIRNTQIKMAHELGVEVEY